MLKDDIEKKRYKLYECLIKYNNDRTLQVSQDLDKLIVEYYRYEYFEKIVKNKKE